jgi:hypothetical protein
MRFRMSLALMGIALIFAACSASSSRSQVSEGRAPVIAPLAPEAKNATGDAFMAPQAARSADNAGAGSSSTAAYSTSAPDAQLPRLDRMVVSSVNLTISVDNAVNAARLAEGLASRYGGYVGNSSVRDVDGAREASLTVRVASASLNEALTELRAVGKRVTDESRSTQDVTEEYTDVDANLRNLRASEERVLALMERAARIEDVLSLQRELTGIRGQIERLEGRKRLLENRADLATISMRLTETSPTRATGWNPLETFGEAWATLARASERIASAAIWILVFFPLWGIPALAVWWLSRHRSGRRTATTSA